MEMRRNVFPQRAVGLCNSLPQRAVEAASLNILKIQRFLIEKGVKGDRKKSGVKITIRSAMILMGRRWPCGIIARLLIQKLS